MANFGRFVCVLVPFALTLGSLIALLVAGLAGVADKSLYMFQVNTTNLQFSPLDAASIIKDFTNVNGKSVEDHVKDNIPDNLKDKIPDNVKDVIPDEIKDIIPRSPNFHNPELLGKAASGTNVTGTDLGLADLYDVGIWGYCYTHRNGTRDCTKPKFNWAESVLNATAGDIKSLITLTGQNITLSKEVSDAITAFSTVARWTQIVFVIACIATGVALFFGIFANCSRIFSCVTFIIAAFATVSVCAAAALSTAMAVVVVGTVEATAKLYGVEGSFNVKFLAAVWIAAAFAIAAGFFWLFTICCCAPDRSGGRSSRRSKNADGEKLLHGPYQPLGNEHGYQGGSYPQYSAPQSYGPPKADVAYEPYSHARA